MISRRSQSPAPLHRSIHNQDVIDRGRESHNSAIVYEYAELERIKDRKSDFVTSEIQNLHCAIGMLVTSYTLLEKHTRFFLFSISSADRLVLDHLTNREVLNVLRAYRRLHPRLSETLQYVVEYIETIRAHRNFIVHGVSDIRKIKGQDKLAIVLADLQHKPDDLLIRERVVTTSEILTLSEKASEMLQYLDRFMNLLKVNSLPHVAKHVSSLEKPSLPDSLQKNRVSLLLNKHRLRLHGEESLKPWEY